MVKNNSCSPTSTFFKTQTKHSIMGIDGTLLEYGFKQHAFEFGNLKSDKVVIFIGGLGDRFATVPYLVPLSNALNKIGWSLIQIEFTSSSIGWGTGSLARDHSEITKLVKFLKSEDGGSRKKVGLMGHSTGCQNTMYYLSKAERDENYVDVDFGILQASVSDREAAGELMEKETIEKGNALAKKYIDEGKSDELMPYNYTLNFFGAPVNAYRWYSLFSKRGDDDFFSSDLEDDDFKLTFGKVDKPLLVLYGGCDEFAPDYVDKALLLSRFKSATKPGIWSPYSKIIEGGKHNLGEGSKETAVDDCLVSVCKLLENL